MIDDWALFQGLIDDLVIEPLALRLVYLPARIVEEGVHCRAVVTRGGTLAMKEPPRGGVRIRRHDVYLAELLLVSAIDPDVIVSADVGISDFVVDTDLADHRGNQFELFAEPVLVAGDDFNVIPTDSGLGHQLLGFLQIAILGIAQRPLAVAEKTVGDLVISDGALTVVNLVDDGLAIDRVGDRLAH